MRVDAVMMRGEGVKLSDEAIQQAIPVRDHLPLRRVPCRGAYMPSESLVPTAFAAAPS